MIFMAPGYSSFFRLPLLEAVRLLVLLQPTSNNKKPSNTATNEEDDDEVGGDTLAQFLRNLVIVQSYHIVESG